MTTGRVSRYWVSVTLVLAALIVAGGLFGWTRYRPVTAITLKTVADPPTAGTIYVGGAVPSPLVCAYQSTDTIAELLRAAGGATDNASLELRVLDPNEGPQRVDINRAEAWLLTALPGIGETLAARIVDYRQTKGPFRSTEDLMRIGGIGQDTYNKIKDKITVAD